MRRVVFLDIDGVLNTERSALRSIWPHRRDPYFHWCRIAIENLNILVEETGSKIVISSSWRFGRGCSEMQSLLNARGVRCTVVGHTPNLLRKEGDKYISPKRGEEIDAYLKEHPEISTYVIIDDDTDMLEHQLPFFVNTNEKTGFDFKAYQKALKILTL